jgi:hypothetical protein
MAPLIVSAGVAGMMWERGRVADTEKREAPTIAGSNRRYAATNQ